MSRELVGHIGVDAGMCWIGDPCYILHTKPPDTLGKNWKEFCDLLGEDFPIKKSFNYEMGHEGLGCVVNTGLGDGFYPVYADISDNRVWGKRIKSITVEFLSDEE